MSLEKLNVEHTYDGLQKEIGKRLEKYTGLGDTISILLRRACVKIVSKNSVPYLLDYISKLRGSSSVDDNHLGQAAEMLVADISSALPAIYKSQTEKLVSLILDKNPITG